MNYFTIAGMPVRVLTPSIIMDYQLQTSSESLIGIPGSTTEDLGRDGKEITFTIVARSFDDVETIRALVWNRAVVPVVSPARAGYNVQWRLTKFVQKDKSTPKNPDSFEYDVTMQEHTDHVVTKQKFTNWKVTKSKDPCTASSTYIVKDKIVKANAGGNPWGLLIGQDVNIGTKKKPKYVTVTSPTPIMDSKCVKSTASNPSKLSKCPTLEKDSKKNTTECVKTLQKALRTKGYYLKVDGYVVKVDGVFGPLTKKEVIRFQENHKISPANGVVGDKTKAKL